MYSATQNDAMTLMATLADKSVNAIITDPPYGQTQLAFDKANRGASNICLSPDFWHEVWRVTDVFICTAIHPFTAQLVVMQERHYRHAYVWVKNKATGFLDAKRKPLRIHEDVIVFATRQTVYNPQMAEGEPYLRDNHGIGHCVIYTATNRTDSQSDGERYPTTLLEFASDVDVLKHLDPDTHPTQKPVALMEYLVKTYTHEGDTVLDPFMGSGTTGVACQRTGRHFIGCDIAPEYVALANHRLAKTEMAYAPNKQGFTQLSLFASCDNL
jgi:DNA modification methylase